MIIIFGLFIADVIKIDFLLRERRLNFAEKPAGYLGTSLVGMGFAAGWTPCIGPILGSILMYAGAHGSVSYGVKLLGVYSFGLSLPFIISAVGFNFFLSYSRKILRHMKTIKIISGIFLIIFGILLFSNMISELSGLFPDFGLDLPLPK